MIERPRGTSQRGDPRGDAELCVDYRRAIQNTPSDRLPAAWIVSCHASLRASSATICSRSARAPTPPAPAGVTANSCRRPASTNATAAVAGSPTTVISTPPNGAQSPAGRLSARPADAGRAVATTGRPGRRRPASPPSMPGPAQPSKRRYLKPAAHCLVADAELAGGLVDRDALPSSSGWAWIARGASARARVGDHHPSPALAAPKQSPATVRCPRVRRHRPAHAAARWLAASRGWRGTDPRSRSRGGARGCRPPSRRCRA